MNRLIAHSNRCVGGPQMPQGTKDLIRERVAISKSVGVPPDAISTLLEGHFSDLRHVTKLGQGTFSIADRVSYFAPKTQTRVNSVLKLCNLSSEKYNRTLNLSFRLNSNNKGGEFYALFEIGPHVLQSTHAIVFDNQNQQFVLLTAKKVQQLMQDVQLSLSYTLAGTLAPFIPNAKPLSQFKNLKINKVRWFAKQLLVGIRELHQKNIAHRDIKPDNTLVTNEGRLVIIDFGFACEIPAGKKKDKGFPGTPGFQASEMRRRDPYDKRVDLASAGFTILWMATNKSINDFFNEYQRTTFHNSTDLLSKSTTVQKAVPNKKLLNLIAGLTDPVVKRRYTIERALAQPFFSR